MFVDLNSDLGESFGSWKMGNDDQILPVVTSANIACGFHAGDPLGILKTLRKAVELNVAIGAHVSYPDLVGFGRRNMDVSRDELIADVLYQISALDGLAKVAGSHVQYVKPMNHHCYKHGLQMPRIQPLSLLHVLAQPSGNLPVPPKPVLGYTS
jgi:UPF0271 protein